MRYSFDDLELLKRNQKINQKIICTNKFNNIDNLCTIFVDNTPTFVCRKNFIHNKCINYLNYVSNNFNKIYNIECIKRGKEYKLYSRLRNSITSYDYLETTLRIRNGIVMNYKL